MIRIFWVNALLLMFFLVSGQNQSNPFDLKFRPANPIKSLPVPPVDTISRSGIPVEPKPVTKTDSSLDSAEGHDSLKTVIDENPFELEDDTSDINSPVKSETGIDKSEQPVFKSPLQGKRPSKGIQIFFL